MIPDIQNSSREEREMYIKEHFKCISDCDSCGICTIYRNQDPVLVYKDNIGGGRTDTFYQPYIDGEKELREINAEYIAGRVKG